ncbi:MAG TPA: phospholipase D-like domain-containing protein [Arachnia sp.]|nr:phospholipase D-like domain-containing protein [Arachnia sp.]HMT84743.1 phospholipase D-like domain-containing protein [Arachnia sp.]
MTRFARLRTWINRATLGILLAQIGLMIGLTVLESARNKRRKLRKFPTVAPVPIQAGEDEVTVYTYGEDLYADMIAEIHRAERVIYFETFIWKSDAVGQRFKDALTQAAERGVTVHVVWDEFANLVVPRGFLRMPRSLRVMRHPFFPMPWSPRHWGRDHRKLLVIDSRVGFVGGYNIGSLYATGWRDTHARVVGPGVAELENAFIDFWNLHLRRGRHGYIADDPPRRWVSKLRVHRNTPRIQVYPIRNMYLEAIDRAQHRIWLTHAYLLPDADLVAALRDAARRGVDVRIIIPHRSNHVVADWLSRNQYATLLQSGVRLFLYQGAMVHAKTATIDGSWSTIGTANLDRLSLMGNYEVNLEVTDEDVADQMEKIFRVDESNTIELTEDRWHARSRLAKLTEVLLSPWRPIF